MGTQQLLVWVFLFASAVPFPTVVGLSPNGWVRAWVSGWGSGSPKLTGQAFCGKNTLRFGSVLRFSHDQAGLMEEKCPPQHMQMSFELGISGVSCGLRHEKGRS